MHSDSFSETQHSPRTRDILHTGHPAHTANKRTNGGPSWYSRRHIPYATPCAFHECNVGMDFHGRSCCCVPGAGTHTCVPAHIAASAGTRMLASPYRRVAWCAKMGALQCAAHTARTGQIMASLRQRTHFSASARGLPLPLAAPLRQGQGTWDSGPAQPPYWKAFFTIARHRPMANISFSSNVPVSFFRISLMIFQHNCVACIPSIISFQCQPLDLAHSLLL